MSDVIQPVVLVTGSGRQRVGQAIAKDLAARGYRVAVHYFRSHDAAEQLVNELRQSGYRAHAFQADLREQAEVERMVSELRGQLGRIDVLVHTASSWTPIALEETTADDVINSFQTNTLSTFLCCQYVGLLMAAQPEGGAIITMGDALVRHPYLNFAAYFTAKGAIETVTKLFAVELASRNPRVRVNGIHAGPILFPQDASPQERQSMVDSTLLKTADCPDQVTHAVRFLIENKFITGEMLVLDGGRNIGGITR